MGEKLKRHHSSHRTPLCPLITLSRQRIGTEILKPAARQTRANTVLWYLLVKAFDVEYHLFETRFLGA